MLFQPDQARAEILCRSAGACKADFEKEKQLTVQVFHRRVQPTGDFRHVREMGDGRWWFDGERAQAVPDERCYAPGDGCSFAIFA
jgi:hypothetical protein